MNNFLDRQINPDIEQFTIMESYAEQKVNERDMEIKEFLFNTHRVVEDKIVLNLADILNFFTPNQ